MLDNFEELFTIFDSQNQCFDKLNESIDKAFYTPSITTFLVISLVSLILFTIILCVL